jgi:hypothetical protein
MSKSSFDTNKAKHEGVPFRVIEPDFKKMSVRRQEK